MTTWLPRGVVFAIGMVLLRLVQGTLINTYPTNAGTISLALVVVFGVAAFIWGLLDGIADARANSDPDRRRDLAMRWLLAGLFAGAVSGAAVWLISLFYKAVYADGLGAEITAFAAFTALLIFLPAMLAVGVGRWLVDRNTPDEPRRTDSTGVETDVFDSVRDDEPRTGPIPPISAAAAAGALDYPEEYPSQIALADRGERDIETEQIAGQIHDESERIEDRIEHSEAEDRDRDR